MKKHELLLIIIIFNILIGLTFVFLCLIFNVYSGMEALETVINFWEDALVAYETLTTPDESEFCREIQSLLDLAWQLQDQSELLFLDQRSILFRNGSHAGEKNALHRSLSDPNFDSAESFASALDQVHRFTFNFPLYLKIICWNVNSMGLAD